MNNSINVDADIHLYFTQNLLNLHLYRKLALSNSKRSNDLRRKECTMLLENLKSLGYDQVVIIGTDCLELTSKIINNAFIALNSSDYVLGPANDGGYYLLGLTELNDVLFSE